jgi:hypothetical protein
MQTVHTYKYLHTIPGHRHTKRHWDTQLNTCVYTNTRTHLLAQIDTYKHKDTHVHIYKQISPHTHSLTYTHIEEFLNTQDIIHTHTLTQTTHIKIFLNITPVPS